MRKKKQARPKPPTVSAELVAAIVKQLGLPASLVRQYPSQLARLAWPVRRHADEPDFSKPGTSGTRSDDVDKAFFWDDEAEGWEEFDLPPPIDPCEAQVVEVSINGKGDCPPAGGFAALVARAERKALDEARAIPCPNCPSRYVAVTYREWGCFLGVLPTVTVQAQRWCNTA